MDLPMDMQHQAMGYDRTATMFSPEGTIIQVEYAEKATKWGSSSIGMVCTDGVLIVADKRIDDKLIVPKSANKVYEIDSHIIASAAGVVSDARVLVEKAQVISQQHRMTYDSPVEPELIIKDIANIEQQFTQYGGARPFGVFFMIAGMNDKKPELYVSNVSGNYFSYYANAIGENDEKVKEKLREKYKHDLNIKKGIKVALDIFKEIQGNKFDAKKFEVVYIENNGKIIRMDGAE